LAIELMLLAVNMNFIAFRISLGTLRAGCSCSHPHGGGRESAIGLAILVVLFRNLQRSTSTISTT